MSASVSVEFSKDKVQQITERLDRHAQDAARAARRRRMAEDLHEEYVVKPMLWCKCRRTPKNCAQAEELVAWARLFEKSGLRTKLQGQFGEAELPIAHAKVSLRTPGHEFIKALVLEGELRVYIHPKATIDGIYRYVECVEGFVMRKSHDMKRAEDLICTIHPDLMEKLHYKIVCDGCWKPIEDWIELQSEHALRNG